MICCHNFQTISFQMVTSPIDSPRPGQQGSPSPLSARFTRAAQFTYFDDEDSDDDEGKAEGDYDWRNEFRNEFVGLFDQFRDKVAGKHPLAHVDTSVYFDDECYSDEDKKDQSHNDDDDDDDDVQSVCNGVFRMDEATPAEPESKTGPATVPSPDQELDSLRPAKRARVETDSLRATRQQLRDEHERLSILLEIRGLVARNTVLRNRVYPPCEMAI